MTQLYEFLGEDMSCKSFYDKIDVLLFTSGLAKRPDSKLKPLAILASDDVLSSFNKGQNKSTVVTSETPKHEEVKVYLYKGNITLTRYVIFLVFPSYVFFK